jgi:hypothetical protein
MRTGTNTDLGSTIVVVLRPWRPLWHVKLLSHRNNGENLQGEYKTHSRFNTASKLLTVFVSDNIIDTVARAVIEYEQEGDGWGNRERGTVWYRLN